MKKSTILLLFVVYVVSFFIIGLLGHSIRSYNPEIYPESIELIDPNEKTTRYVNYADPETGVVQYDYYFVFKNFHNSDSMRIKALVKPDNTTYPDVICSKDEQNTEFNLLTHSTNEEIEEGFCVITLNRDLEPFEVFSAPFLVISKNPGTQIKLKACVTFVGAIA